MGLGHEGIEHCTALSTSTVLYVCGSLYARHCPQRYEGLVIPLEIGREAGRGARDGMSLDWISGHCRLHLRARQRGSDELPVAQRKVCSDPDRTRARDVDSRISYAAGPQLEAR